MRYKSTNRVVVEISSALLLAFFAVALPPVIHGQAVYGSINGTVVDPTGAAVAGATVTVTDQNKGTKDAAKTNVDGNYLMVHLIPGTYKVHVEAAGFSSAESQEIQLAADTSPRVDIQLKPGRVSETIEVTSETPQLKTDRADVATVLNTRSVEDLPNLTRNATSLTLLAPGAAPSGFNNSISENPQQSIPVSVNGMNPFSAGFVLDGANNKDSFIGEVIINPPLDSIQEMKFVSQNYDAEFGAAVAGVTVATTKSGSNSFHGSAFEYRYSDATEARNPFTQYNGANPDPVTGKQLGPVIPPSMYNLFGGSIGGPIKKNKIFFFGDYQGQREKSGSSFVQSVPTALVHQTCTGTTGNCDLSEYLAQGQAYNPTTGVTDPASSVYGSGRTAYASNQIPNSQLSPQAQYLLNLLPMATRSGISNNLVSSGFGVFNDNQFDTRIDAQVSENLHVFGRYGLLDAKILSPGSLGALGGLGFFSSGFAGTSKGRNQNLSAGADLAVSSSVFTDFRFTYFRYRILQGKYDGSTPLEQNAGIPGINTGAYGSGGAAGFIPDGIAAFGSSNRGVNHCNCPLDETEQEYSLVNNWTKIFGNHSLKLGGEFRILKELRIPSDDNRSGEIHFYASSTGLASTTTMPGDKGLGLATFLLGDVSTFARYFTPSGTSPAEHQERTFLYVQDNWRVTRKLTLNLGVRWEDYTPEAVSGKGQGAYYNAQTNNIQVAGYGSVGMNLNVQNRWTYFLPRVGLAYEVTPKTVVRAGYGRSLDPSMWGTIFGQMVTQTFPVLQDQQVSSSPNSYASAFNLAAGPPAPASSLTIPSNGLIPAYGPNGWVALGIAPMTRTNQITLSEVDGWNATVQRQLTPTVSLQVGYVGNKGTHMGASSAWAGNDWNVYSIKGGPLTQNLSVCQRSVYYSRFGQCFQGGAGWLTAFDQIDNSHYNSLQTVIDKRFSKGLQFEASYVYSRSSGHGGWQYNEIDQNVMQGPFDYNRQSAFKLWGNYVLPFGKGGVFADRVPGLMNKILGGIAINGTWTYASGLPYSLALNDCSAEQDGSWTTPCRPDQVGHFSQGNSHLINGAGVAPLVQWFTPVSTPLATPGATAGAFRAPAVEAFGNSGYNAVFGPSYNSTDLSLTKTFALTERFKMQFQAIAQNAFNHVNLGNPNTCVDCSWGGQIAWLANGAGMRQLEFAARFTF